MLFSHKWLDLLMSQAKSLTQRELQQVLGYISSMRFAQRNRAMMLLSHWAGMRVGEIAALRFCDVVDEAGNIRSEVRLLASQTKGSRARTVYMPEKLRKELAHYVKHIGNCEGQQHLFTTQKQSAFSANTLAEHFKKVYNACGLKGASSHSGRRTFLTQLAAKGVSVRVLMGLAGHRNIATTQRYIDVNDEMQRAAVELI